ncbi:MAG: CBS domain-containing protein [Chloroflexota bacterium]
MNEAIPDSARKRVGDIMTTAVVKVRPDTRVDQIARLMADHDISGLPVVDDNDRVLGVVTELDMIVRNTRFKVPNFIMILDSIIYLETPQHFRERLEHMLGVTAKEIMSKPAVTITPEATIEELARLMVERRMNPIPVVADERLVGIISRFDIIRLMARD